MHAVYTSIILLLRQLLSIHYYTIEDLLVIHVGVSRENLSFPDDDVRAAVL